MAFTLSPATIELLEGRNYAVLATVNPDGSPHTSAMWVGRDGNDVVMSTVAGRRKYRNMVRDPRISVTVIDATDGENYVELRGQVTLAADIGLIVDNRLSWKYDGKDKDPDQPGTERVIVRLLVAKATGRAA